MHRSGLMLWSTRSSILQVIVDMGAWCVALVVAVVLRYEFDLSSVWWPSLFGAAVAASLAQLAVGWILHLYRGRFAYGSLEEVRAMAFAIVTVALVLTVPLFAFSGGLRIPRSTIFIATPIALIFMLTARYVQRLRRERRLGPTDESTPALIYGAGYMGGRLVRELSADARGGYRIIGILDDDPNKKNAQVRSTRVVGTFADLDAVVERTGVQVLIVAIASAEAEFLRTVQDAASRVRVRVLVMPPLAHVLARENRVDDLRELSIEDLIGRQPVDTEVESIAGYITGRRVLVTGAGGSIGSELCRQLSKFDPLELVMLDRDETGLQLAQLSTMGHGLLDTQDVVLADIRDAEVIRDIFVQREPEVVFHAAALKHLPMLEQYPDEAWKTNVLGTLNVLNAARDAGATTFVNISTDKAANPSSVLGHSKRLAEKLTRWAAERPGSRYLSVRFGNVIGSRGSMLPTFASLIRAGGPVTVTHPDATRYFMTIPEACQLVIQAGAIGRSGEVLILDMGEPVRVLDVAKRMIAMSGKAVDIVYTGLRDGEKLHEELVGENEKLERPFHPKISHTQVGVTPPQELDEASWMAAISRTSRRRQRAGAGESA